MIPPTREKLSKREEMVEAVAATTMDVTMTILRETERFRK